MVINNSCVSNNGLVTREFISNGKTVVEISKYVGNDSVVNLPRCINRKRIVRIASDAFKDNQDIEQINFGSSFIEEIGESAFEGCVNLSYISLPTSVKRIGDSAFKNTGIEYAVLSRNLEEIGNECFMDCANLETVNFSRSYTSIGDRAFKNCTKLNKLNGFTDYIKRIGYGAFSQPRVHNDPLWDVRWRGQRIRLIVEPQNPKIHR